MKVKLLVSREAVNYSQAVGDIVEVDDAEGARMITAGQCVEIGTGRETATKKTKYETASKK